MKKVLIPLLALLPTALWADDIKLPELPPTAGTDVTVAMETRTETRTFTGKEIPMNVVGAIAWAAGGITLTAGKKTVHGHDAVSGATKRDRRTVPKGWRAPYLQVYVVLPSGIYEYLPSIHTLRPVYRGNLLTQLRSNGTNPAGALLMVSDYDEMPQGKTAIAHEVSFMSAGAAAQNAGVMAAAHGVQVLTEVSFNKEVVRPLLKLPHDADVLALMPFGYASGD